jgi:drug/metabolite transporter (DMT)-like permease
MNKLSKFGPYLIFVAAMLWATDAPFRVYLTGQLTSNFIVLAEHLVDIIIAVPILIWVWPELKKLNAKSWVAVLFIAIGGSALASIAFTEAFHYLNPSVAILLQKLQPLIAITLAAGMLRERLREQFWLWAALALAGAYVISFPRLVPQLYVGEQFNPTTIGVLLALLAAVLWATSTVLGKYVLGKVSFKAMTSLRFVFAFLFLAILNAYQGSLNQISLLTGKDILFITIIAMASGIVSLYIYYGGLQYTKASIATIAELGFPLAAVLVNFIFLKATLVPVQIVGMVVLVLAIWQLGRVNKEESALPETPADSTPVIAENSYAKN